jgi:acid phosphatase
MTSIGTRAGRAVFMLLAGILAIGLAPPEPETAPALPRPDHTVVVIMENHAYSDVVGNRSAPYIASLRNAGATFTDSHAVAHPSQPNYLALFAGGTENLSDNSCPHTFSSANLASGLLASAQTFLGYCESMPSNGYTGCDSGNYARRHNPWVNYANVPRGANLTFDAFPADYGELPTVAYVVPDLCHDMHDCGVATGDAWLESKLDGYVQWSLTHNSLFVLTFDEDAGNTPSNHILTIFVGPMVQAGDYPARIDHYSVLRTLEDMYGVPATGGAVDAEPIIGVWKVAPPTLIPRPKIFRVPRPTRKISSEVSRPDFVHVVDKVRGLGELREHLARAIPQSSQWRTRMAARTRTRIYTRKRRET